MTHLWHPLKYGLASSVSQLLLSDVSLDESLETELWNYLSASCERIGKKIKWQRDSRGTRGPYQVCNSSCVCVCVCKCLYSLCCDAGKSKLKRKKKKNNHREDFRQEDDAKCRKERWELLLFRVQHHQNPHIHDPDRAWAFTCVLQLLYQVVRCLTGVSNHWNVCGVREGRHFHSRSGWGLAVGSVLWKLGSLPAAYFGCLVLWHWGRSLLRQSV